MTNYSSQLSQHFLSPWPDACEVWGLTLKRMGAASLLPGVCAPLSLRVFPQTCNIHPASEHPGGPSAHSQGSWGAPSSPGHCPNSSDLLRDPGLSSVSLTPGSPLGSSWAPPRSSILQTLSGQTRHAQDPCLLVLSGTMRLEWLMPRVLRAVVSCDLSVGDFVLGGFWWEGKSSLCYPVFAGSRSPLPLTHVLVLLPQSLQLMRV